MKVGNPKGKGYYFVGFRDGVSVNNQGNADDFSEVERIVRYSFDLKVPIYLMLNPDTEPLAYGKENGRPVVYKYQNAVDVKMEEDILSEKEYLKIFFPSK